MQYLCELIVGHNSEDMAYLLPGPPQCRCHPGFRLKQDGKTCVDVDECTTTYPCAQRCINTHGSFHCLCVDGFETRPDDPTSCKSTSGEPLPMFSYVLVVTKTAMEVFLSQSKKSKR